MSWQKVSRARAADKHFPRTRTLKSACNKEDCVSFRGHFSIAAEELRWRNLHADGQRERGQRGGRRIMKCVTLVPALIWYHQVIGNASFDRFPCLFRDSSGFYFGEVKDRTKEHYEYVSDPQQLLRKGNSQPTRTLTQSDPSDLPQPRSEIFIGSFAPVRDHATGHRRLCAS